MRALCIDEGDGAIVWNVEVFRPDAAAAKQVHSKNSLASPTPTVDGDRLYVHFGHMGTAALDLDGNVVWRQTALTYKPTHGNGGSPSLADGALVFSCDAAQDPFVAALAYFLFGETVDAGVALGSATIFLSIAYIAYRESRLASRA